MSALKLLSFEGILGSTHQRTVYQRTACWTRREGNSPADPADWRRGSCCKSAPFLCSFLNNIEGLCVLAKSPPGRRAACSLCCSATPPSLRAQLSPPCQVCCKPQLAQQLINIKKFTFKPFLIGQFSAIKYIHMVIQPSPRPISRTSSSSTQTTQ